MRHEKKHAEILNFFNNEISAGFFSVLIIPYLPARHPEGNF
jgi:hypothetical protein